MRDDFKKLAEKLAILRHFLSFLSFIDNHTAKHTGVPGNRELFETAEFYRKTLDEYLNQGKPLPHHLKENPNA